MGYTRLVQYGEFNLVYEYSKSLNTDRRHVQKRKRRNTGTKIRLHRNVKRTRDTFFRLCHHNVTLASTVTFSTLTLATDVSYTQFNRYISEFFARLNKYVSSKGHRPVSYIGVPELTKKGRYHLHLLIFNLPADIIKNERASRNIQRLYGRGYMDLRPAKNRSPRISSYMAKYMVKTLNDPRHEHRRAFSSSRNIEKVRSYGSNALSSYLGDLVDGDLSKVYNYETKYFGNCKLSIFKK